MRFKALILILIMILPLMVYGQDVRLEGNVKSTINSITEQGIEEEIIKNLDLLKNLNLVENLQEYELLVEILEDEEDD